MRIKKQESQKSVSSKENLSFKIIKAVKKQLKWREKSKQRSKTLRKK